MKDLDFNPDWREKSIDRLEKVYKGEIPDRVPGYTVEDFPMPDPGRMYFDPELQFNHQVRKLHMQEEDGMDVVPGVRPLLNPTFYPSLFGAKIDFPKGGDSTLKPYYERTGDWPRIKEHPLKDIRDAGRLDIPDVRKAGQGPLLIRTLQYFKKAARGRVNVGAFCCDGPLYLAFGLMGEKLLFEFYDHPDEVRALLRFCARTIFEVTRIQKEIIEEPMDACLFGDDDVYIPRGHGGVFVGLTHAALISAEMYREIVKPVDDEFFRWFGGGGIHTCGNHAHLFEEFAALPISMMRFYAGEYEPARAKQTVGRDKVILGVKASAHGGAVPGADDLIETIKQCKAGGRFILGPNGTREGIKTALRTAGQYA